MYYLEGRGMDDIFGGGACGKMGTILNIVLAPRYLDIHI